MERTLMIGDHLYVSKVSYGPRLPNTPLSVPFTQNILFGKIPSYLTWIQWPYKRLAGFGEVKRDDIVVFNYPEGDTVVLEFPGNLSYYEFINSRINELKSMDSSTYGKLKTYEQYYAQARKEVFDHYTVVWRPVDKTDNYVKRCVAIGGDTLQVINGEVYVNGKQQWYPPQLKSLARNGHIRQRSHLRRRRRIYAPDSRKLRSDQAIYQCD